ncbi:Putative protein without homology [Lacticaseibacillus rhamnosus GG]|nr:Putative protein without homology [Lacticaseibacillus rhamnosus GG]
MAKDRPSRLRPLTLRFLPRRLALTFFGGFPMQVSRHSLKNIIFTGLFAAII